MPEERLPISNLTMRSICLIAIAVAGISFPNPSLANPVTTDWRFNNLFQFDYLTGISETPSVPTTLDVQLTFPNLVTQAIDYGDTTITYFGEIGDSSFQSPLTVYIGDDPYGGGIDAAQPYTFPNTSDYPSTFYEEFAAQSNAYSPSGDRFWAYHIEIRVRRYTDPRSGVGSDDYAFTEVSLLDFLNDVQVSPDDYSFIFNESWAEFDGGTGEYLGGKSWASYEGELLQVAVTAVPEPSTMLLLGSGLAGLGYFRRRKIITHMWR